MYMLLVYRMLLTLVHNKFKATCIICVTSCISPRSKRLGCVSVMSLLSLDSSMTSRPRSSSRTHWSSGQPGWREWYTPSWSRTREGETSSPRLRGSSSSSGPSTGTYRGQCVCLSCGKNGV